MSLSTWAITLAVAGGLFEAIGVGMVIREIGADRQRAASLLRRERPPRTRNRRYPSKIPVPGGSASPGSRSRIGGRQMDVYDLRAEVEKGFAILGNGITENAKRADEADDRLEDRLLIQVDVGDDELRLLFREVLESDLTERWIAVGALLLGIALAATASVLGTLS